MKTIKNRIMILLLLVSFASCNAQIKNETSITEKISGNCGMCKKTIEKAGSIKNEAEVNWNKETKLATITFDAKKTTKDAVLKRIALAGYDNNSYLAPKDAYNNLPQCCQYERRNEQENVVMPSNTKHKENSEVAQTNLENVFETYFELKDALVDSNSKSASKSASDLVIRMEKVDMQSLDAETHRVWMEKRMPLKENTSTIASSKELEEQRTNFKALSENIYVLMKASKLNNAIYYQHCPMANEGKGANWLSKEKEIKNPYYGSMMLSCGKIIETIE